MKQRVICHRHGQLGDPDGQLQQFVDSLGLTARRIVSLIDYDGYLWINWSADTDLQAADPAIEALWIARGGLAVVHVKNANEDFDYLEDCASGPAEDMRQFLIGKNGHSA